MQIKTTHRIFWTIFGLYGNGKSIHHDCIQLENQGILLKIWGSNEGVEKLNVYDCSKQHIFHVVYAIYIQVKIVLG